MKIVFMGTPDFAVGALEALVRAGHTVTAVVTQPDKPKGRSGVLQMPPVKECALRLGIPVMQPVRIKTPEAIAELKKYEADIYIVAAFGQILSREILDIPPYGCLNIHASLLPKYRGASPIQRVIIDGETVTGVTIQQMNEGVDTGDILYKKEIQIDARDTYETLHERLRQAGAQAIAECLALLETGGLVPEKQRDEDSCYAPLISREMGRIDFAKSADSIDRLVRGLNPWPSAYTFYQGKQLKLWNVYAEQENAQEKPGTVIGLTKQEIRVATGEGILCVTELQLEGKKRMSAHDFMLSGRPRPGEVLG